MFPEPQVTSYSDEFIPNYWMGLGDTANIRTEDVLCPKTMEEKDRLDIFLLRFILNPKNLYFTVKNIFNIEPSVFQMVILDELFTHKYPMLIASRGASKSFTLALYSMIKASLNPGIKVVMVGAGFRQAKVVFEYCEKIWFGAPVLRSMFAGTKSGPTREPDKWTMLLGESQIIALPLGNGDKIRGQRANIIVADEFSTIPLEIYETVIAGFAAVASDPSQAVKRAAREEALKVSGNWDVAGVLEDPYTFGNQSIIAGTAYYSFHHFYKYYRQYKGIVESKGDKDKLREVFQGNIPEKFNWRDYVVIKLPAELLPPGFMDEQNIARSKATSNQITYQMEYGACFSSDSNGFFKRSLIEKCVTKTPIQLPSGPVQFHANIVGNPASKFIYGIDPASEKDNFSIVIIEIKEDHRRIVYCWTTTRSQYKELVQIGKTGEQTFYSYCAKKIRQLMIDFPCLRIAIDTQGGGHAIMEALHDKDKMGKGELPLWEVEEEGVNKDSDSFAGHHILVPINFAKAEWVKEANHGMRKDFEDRVLLFPVFDSLEVALAGESGVDTLEDCMLEIEELKDELATIIHTQTPSSNRDRWDTPEVKELGSKKGRLRKDRYSALLMANMVARQIFRDMTVNVQPTSYGGFAVNIRSGKDKKEKMANQTSSRQEANTDSGGLYNAPDWFTRQVAGGYGVGINRSRR